MLRKLMGRLAQSGTRQPEAVRQPPHANDADEMLRSRYGRELFASQYDLDCAGLLFRHMGSLRLPYIGGHFAHELPDGEGGYRFSHVFGPPEGHLLTIAGEDGDPETRQIMPTIMTYRGSMLIVDPDGFYSEHTCDDRFDDPDNPGGLRRVFRFDPFGERTDRYNPLDVLTEKASGTWGDACIMADVLIAPRDRLDDVEIQAKALLAGILMHVARTSEDEERTMGHVRDLTALHSKGFEALRTEMAKSDDDNIRAAAAAFRDMTKGTQRAVRERLDSDLTIWDSPEIRAATSASSEDFQMRFLHHHEGMTVYLIVPRDRLPDYAPMLRLLVGQAATCFNKPMFNNPVWADARPSGPPVMLVLDWLDMLGYTAPLVDRALAYDSGHIKMWWIVRSIDDLATFCGEGLVEAMFHRFQTISFYQLDDEAAAEQAATLLRDLTERRRKHLRLDDDYPTLSAREIRNLPPSTGIALIKGLPPAILRLPLPSEIEDVAGLELE